MCNNNGVRDCKELLELSKHIVREYIFYDEAIKSKIRNRMGGEIFYDSVREASTTGIPLIEICNKWLFAVVSMTHSLVFRFLVSTVVNLLFYRLHHFIGSGRRVVAFL